MIERLAFDGDATYNAIEASSHLARYSVARPFCAGRRVLDIACGQGYGSFFMKQHWGAAQVDGVDVDPSAVETARTIFAADGIRYHSHPAERIDELFEPASFDLIVCLETIEHVKDPQVLLQTLKKHLAPDGVVIVSCPNDYWYYPTEQQGNPFHNRKFRFPEFRDLAQAEFGPAAMFLFGTPVSGFANLAIDDAYLLPGALEEGPLAIQRGMSLSGVEMLPTDERVDDRNCSYFVGVWAPDPQSVRGASVIFPCSMNASAPASGHENVTHLQAEVVSARTELFETRANLAWMTGRARTLEEELSAARAAATESGGGNAAGYGRQSDASGGAVDPHELRVLGLRAAGFQQENEYIKCELRVARASVASLEEQVQALQQDLEQARHQLEAQAVDQRELQQELEQARHQLQAQAVDQRELQQELEQARHQLEAQAVDQRELQQQLETARQEVLDERRAREEQAPQVEDWRRRIENMDRVKRFIPGWAKGGLKKMLRWR